MINGKWVIGLCISKLQELTRSDLVHHLHRQSRKLDMKLMVFNSFVDFFHHTSAETHSSYIYDLLQCDAVDAVVIHRQSFYDEQLVETIIARARYGGKPVILINGKHEGCFTVEGDYDQAYCSVLRHVFGEHGVTDTVFISGHESGNPASEERLSCYRKVLAEYGLPYKTENVYYGQFWQVPTEQAMEKIMENRTRPPQAVICANDSMARAACDWLRDRGWHVPNDVIVTGYDGLPQAELFTPELTTCAENPEGMAQCILEAVQAGIAGQAPFTLHNPYQPIISESCGCPRIFRGDYRRMARHQYQTIANMEAHETQMFKSLDRIFHYNDVDSLYHILSGTILPNSYMCLKSDYLPNSLDENRQSRPYRPEDILLVIPSYQNRDQVSDIDTIIARQLLPHPESWADRDTLSVLCPVYAQDDVCGYYVTEMDNVRENVHNLMRVHNTLNIAFNVCAERYRHLSLRRRMEKVALINQVTGMPNLKGAIQWYEDFRKDHTHLYLTLSVYGLPKYAYISENYGVTEAEEALRLTAECLKMANPRDCYLAHVAEDCFMVLNYYESQLDVEPTINSSVAAFYGQIEAYNKESAKEYYVEVNAGCTIVGNDWSNSLESLIKFANSDMYMNRLHMGMGKVVKEEQSPKDHYRAFTLLVDKNLFQYHFQPIVSARTGEIFGYEALMRTDASIGLNPLEILDTAREYGRLYDIEKATLFNVMHVVTSRRDAFGDKKVFINTIPRHFLNDHDLAQLTEMYNSEMERFIFELTEQETVSDDELDSLHRVGGPGVYAQIAIDDFGTGHSNIVNLLRYNPQYIKIDRFLVDEICKSQNKQLFVRNVVDFAKLNGIRTLAEGVETSNELHMLIDLGVDLIQGYYTGRPQPDPIPSLPEDIRREILEANPTFEQQSQL